MIVSVGIGKSKVNWDMSAVPAKASLKELYTYVQKNAKGAFSKDLLLGRITTAIHKYGGVCTWLFFFGGGMEWLDCVDTGNVHHSTTHDAANIETSLVQCFGSKAVRSTRLRDKTPLGKAAKPPNSPKTRNQSGAQQEKKRVAADKLLQKKLDQAEKIIAADKLLQSKLDKTTRKSKKCEIVAADKPSQSAAEKKRVAADKPSQSAAEKKREVVAADKLLQKKLDQAEKIIAADKLLQSNPDKTSRKSNSNESVGVKKTGSSHTQLLNKIDTIVADNYKPPQASKAKKGGDLKEKSTDKRTSKKQTGLPTFDAFSHTKTQHLLAKRGFDLE